MLCYCVIKVKRVAIAKATSASVDVKQDASFSSAPAGGAIENSDHSRSPRGNESEDSEDEEAPVFITLSAVETSTGSPEQSPTKFTVTRFV